MNAPNPTWKHRAGRWLLPKLPVSRFFVELVRIEVQALAVSAKNTLLPWRRRRLKGLAREPGERANVACGPFVLPGFINLDLRAAHPAVIEYDCRWSLPFPDESLAGIRAEHFVEHLEVREELPAFLAHCRRSLVPSGVLRIVVPDARRYLKAYCDGGLESFKALGVPDPFPADLPTRLDVVNHVFHQRHEHRFGYDFETLSLRLRESGFEKMEQTEFGRSLDPALAADREEHAPYSLYVDAVK